MATELDRAFDHCRVIAKSQAKNFYYAFRTLPARQRRAIFAAYAFCRICDDIADEDHSVVEKRRLLSRTRLLLREPTANGTSDEPVFSALRSVTAEFDIPTEYFEDVIDGVEMDLTHARYNSFEELQAYCYKVASAVGLICLEVFGYRDPSARQYAIDLGLAMQLTNILRDVKEDAQRGRIYIPLDEIEEHGYTERDLLEGVQNAQFDSLMMFQVDRARRYFASGRRLIPLLSHQSRACTAVLMTVYSVILDRIESSGYDVFQRRIGLSTREKVMIAARLWATSLIPALQLRK